MAIPGRTETVCVRVGGTHTIRRRITLDHTTNTVLMIGTDCSGVNASVIGAGAYGTVLDGRVYGESPGDVVVKLQYMCVYPDYTTSGINNGREVEEDVVIEGALAAAAARHGINAGIFPLRHATVVHCMCCKPAHTFALFAYDISPGTALLESKRVDSVTRFDFKLRLGGILLRRFAFEMARAIASLHALNVYHGDLKPAHVYVDGATGDGDDMRVTLLDLGFACEKGRVRRLPMYTGWWRSPEAWDTALVHTVGQPSDIYAYALCMMCAATNTITHRPNNLHEARALCNRLPDVVTRMFAGIDPQLGAILHTCLIFDVDRRPSAPVLMAMLASLENAAPCSYTVPHGAVVFGEGVPVAPPAPDDGDLETQMRMFSLLTLNREAIQTVGLERLTRAVSCMKNSARRIYARLDGWEENEAAHAALMLALKLHWPLRTADDITFNAPSTLRGYVFISRKIYPQSASATLVECALTKLRWDVLA